MSTKTLVKLIAIALAVLFAYAAADKLDHYTLFSLQLKRFPVPIPVIPEQAWVIPVSEFLIALLLLLPFSRLIALFASLFLLGAYTLYLTCMLDSRFHVSCKCGEPFQALSLKTLILVTLVGEFFTGVAVVLSGRLVTPLARDLKQFPYVRPCYEQIDTSMINSPN
jgi:hypothetical protein